MKFFDCHLHLPTLDEKGLSALLRHIEDEPDMVGGNLILNTREEVHVAYRHLASLPSTLNLVPYYEPAEDLPVELRQSGWYKIHPYLQKLDSSKILSILESLKEFTLAPKGLIVHCFPWGTELQLNTSLPLVIELAQARPDIPILVTHGGGYESWLFRAHTGMIKNVVYDFSLTMSYYLHSDLLRPFQRYLRYSPERVVFGSDWPSAECAEQIAECTRLASEIGISAAELETIFMTNARRLWPGN